MNKLIMGSTTTKFVSGNEYLYYVHYVNRKKIEVYCGLASKPESKEKAKKFEIEDLVLQKKSIESKIKKLRTGLRK